MQRLSEFIRDNTEQILEAWEKFARGLPAGDAMDIAALRDHAKEMLRAITTDLDTPQTLREQSEKSKGLSDAATDDAPTAAQEHGAGRATSGYTIDEMVAEFRALRASVIYLWTRDHSAVGAADLEDMTRFNEAIDQAITESITRYTHEVTESKDRFLAILGHDLRTPLGAVIASSVFMLELGELKEPYLTLTSGIANSARRMNQMVGDLLEFTRTRFGDSIPVVRTAMDARKLVHDVVAEVSTLYPGSRLQVETSGELLGRWDSDRLTQALTNLITNAVQHGSEKTAIMVTANGLPSEIVICVHSEGAVIPISQLKRIFEPMKYGQKDGPRDHNHLGLGLYIVDRIVTSHNGTVSVQSSRENGTDFCMHLPRSA